MHLIHAVPYCRMNLRLSSVLTFIVLINLPMSLSAASAAFPATEPGEFEIKTLPAGTLLEATAEGSYFDNSNRLFRPLFRYISSHGIAMTVPVEATPEPGAMYFWVAPEEIAKVSGDKDGVRVIQVNPRTVAAHAARGSYSERNFARVRADLEAWLATQEAWVASGDAYAVYWSGPFTPWFRKLFEVHIPVQPRE